MNAKKHVEYSFVIDAFTLRRGAPALLEISCSSCGHYLVTYQKDGPGPLLRCYWDRIHAPEEMHRLQDSCEEKTCEILACPGCEKKIGEKALYEKESRMAFFLVEDSFLIKELSS
jgi:hypothetical protein